MTNGPKAVAARPPGGRPTQKHVALAAGVSQAAVSIALSNGDTSAVPAATRERIESAARALGYVPNRAAQMLRAARTMTLACVVPDLTNPFYPGLVRGLQDVARRADHDVLIYDTDGTSDGERRALDWMLRGAADGVVGTFFHLGATDLGQLVRRRIPIARLENRARPTGALAIDNLFIDNTAAAAEMTRTLISRGHRRIALLVCELGPGPQRAAGYQAAMREAGLTENVVFDPEFSEAGGMRCMRRLLRRKQRITAVFGASDLLAIGAMAAIREAGLAIPGDIAVAGFDDIPAAKLLMPALTTVRQPEQQLGALAANVLIGRLQPGGMDAPGSNTQLPFQIMLRQSA